MMKALKKALFELSLPQVVKKDVVALGIAKKYWKEVVGEELSGRARPYCVTHGTLVIEAGDSVLAQVISFNASFYLEKLNEKTPPKLKPLFKQIKVRVAPLGEEVREDKNSEKEKFFLKEAKNYLSVCSVLEDKDLKKVFERLIKTYLKCYINKLKK